MFPATFFNGSYPYRSSGFISYEIFGDCLQISLLMISKFKWFNFYSLWNHPKTPHLFPDKEKRINSFHRNTIWVQIYWHLFTLVQKKVTCSKLKIKTLNQSVKAAFTWSLSLTLIIFHTLFYLVNFEHAIAGWTTFWCLYRLLSKKF